MSSGGTTAGGRPSCGEPVVVGAFPEPFLHGWEGKRRPAVVLGRPGEASERIADSWAASVEHRDGREHAPARDGSGFRARLDGAPGDPVVFELGLRDAERLAEPSVARYRYEGLP